MDLGLTDKPVVVTGGSSGIGLATARLLLEEGARVAICARGAERLEKGRVSTFAETTDDAWREELELKYFSQIRPIRAFQDMLAASGEGAIVATNSLLALQPEPHMVCTSSARAGVQNLLKSLARELAPAIRVNSILVGLIDSNQWQRRFEAREDKSQSRDDWYANLARTKNIPMGRLGQPEEAARLLAYLASPAASFITGAQVEISGGISRFI